MDITSTLTPSWSVSHSPSPNTDCEEKGHLPSENSYCSASLILKRVATDKVLLRNLEDQEIIIVINTH